MKKNLFTLGLLATALSLQAQGVLTHVDKDGLLYVGKGALVYNGGGLQVKDNGIWENHGNVMVVGSGTDVFKTVTSTGTNKEEGSAVGGTFVNKINEVNNYALTGNNYTYGQLFISGLSQANVVGIVDQEYRQVKHGAFQQIGLPFYNKTFVSLNAEFNKVFNTNRWSQNEILNWDNTNVVFKNLPSIWSKTTAVAPSHAYYILGSLGLDTSSKVFTIKGVPYAEENTPAVLLADAGEGINFGAGGNAVNAYNERYNTYLQDGFAIASSIPAFTGTFGKNIYQFSNPYLTNIDLNNIMFSESGISDNNLITNLQGIRLEVSGVQFAPNVGGGSTSYKFITVSRDAAGDIAGIAGDLDYGIVRPMQTFALKLIDNSAQPTLNFTSLRRFNFTPRATGTNYSVTAAKVNNTKKPKSSPLKQIAVIGLDAQGYEVGRTYYVVSSNTTTGHSTQSLSQQTNFSTSPIGSFEENAITGGYDNNYTSQYWLYINEANENDFKGKAIPVVVYNPNVKSLKFEVRENMSVVSDGQNAGAGFFINAKNGSVVEAKQGLTIPLTNAEYSLYYGKPKARDIISRDIAEESSAPSRTMVTFDPLLNNHIVIFDPNWKNAKVEVYDMSGKLVMSQDKVDTTNNFEIKLRGDVKNTYVVVITSEKNEKVNAKIIK